jgi:predicted nuclease of restriction endonuclease-like (RecB) superfamily
MKNIVDKGYVEFLNEIKSRIVTARIQAIRSVNKELIALYWDIGKNIVERQQKYKWGNNIVQVLARDLKNEFPEARGFSERNLWNMRRFYEEYRDKLFLQQLVAEIPWGHNLMIMEKISGDNEREYYIRSSRDLGWSRDMLLNQIKANAYAFSQRQKTHNFSKALPVHLAEQADEAMKSVYNLDFLGIARPILERELEKRLVEKVKQFILELGYGFSFLGNQYRLALGNNEYFIDLLFFNRKLKCIVAVELKTGKFEPEYAGKMDFYLHLLDEQIKLKDENPSIGIILCAGKDNIIVEYALRSVKKPVGVAEYYFTKNLPKNFQGKLPDSIALKRSIQQELK